MVKRLFSREIGFRTGANLAFMISSNSLCIGTAVRVLLANRVNEIMYEIKTASRSENFHP